MRNKYRFLVDVERKIMYNKSYYAYLRSNHQNLYSEKTTRYTDI